MLIIVMLIFISLTIALFFLFLFIWSLKSGQYDDTFSPAVRILFEEKKPSMAEKKKYDKNQVATKLPS